MMVRICARLARRADSHADVRCLREEKMRRWIRLTGTVAVLAGCAHRVDVAAERRSLLLIDERFARETASSGAAGWASFFAEDGRMLMDKGPIIAGRDQIREAMAKSFARPGFAIQWEPTSADVSSAGDLGYTTGRFEVVQSGSDGKPAVTGRGKYVTIWKKQSDGSWKVALDIGNSDP